MGLGSAYLEGYKWCINNNFQYILQMDADLSHPPSTAPTLASSIENGYDVAIASRYVEHGGVSSWPIHRRFISFFANLLLKPAARKLEQQHSLIRYRDKILMEGISMLPNKPHPYTVQDHLNRYLDFL